MTTHAIDESDIHEIVEIALDRDLTDFRMDMNFYQHYGMDSLGAVAIVVEVRKRYKVRIPDQRMPEVQTGYQLQDAIQELLTVSQVRVGS